MLGDQPQTIRPRDREKKSVSLAFLQNRLHFPNSQCDCGSPPPKNLPKSK